MRRLCDSLQQELEDVKSKVCIAVNNIASFVNSMCKLQNTVLESQLNEQKRTAAIAQRNYLTEVSIVALSERTHAEILVQVADLNQKVHEARSRLMVCPS